MKNLFRIVLIVHTAMVGSLGLYFYLAPAAAATLWPWVLPPLAARFVGALLIGAAVSTGLTLLSNTHGSSAGILFMGIGYVLMVLTGLLYGIESGFDGHLTVWFIVISVSALLLIGLVMMVSRQTYANSTGTPIPRIVRRYFMLHFIAVAIVGTTMYLLPMQAQPLWPWEMSVVNVRLLGGIFLSAAFYSVWCLRQRTWATIQPTVALYAVFATGALIASLVHFNLFNPARVITWIFVALYAFVGGGAAYFLWQFRMRSA